MNKINITNLEIFPLLLSNTNILPCLDRCYFTKHFVTLKQFNIYKINNNSLHIDVTGNYSYININISGEKYKFIINDIIITFPAIHKFNNNNKNDFFGEILLIFYNSNLKKYSILSVLLNNNVSESTSLCSSLFNEINSYIDDLEQNKSPDDDRTIENIIENNKKYNVGELNGFDINDLLPNNNTFYTYLNNNKLWYIYKNSLSLSNHCSLNIRKIITNNIKQSPEIPNLDIYLYTDLDNTENNNDKCEINIIQKVEYKTTTTDEEESTTDLNIEYSPIENNVSNYVLYTINSISIIIFIILFIYYIKQKNLNTLIKIFVAYCIITFIYSIWYYSINTNNIILQIFNYIMMGINLLGVAVIYLVYNYIFNKNHFYLTYIITYFYNFPVIIKFYHLYH